jgi:acyl carrier protein
MSEGGGLRVITVEEVVDLVRSRLRGKVPADLTIDENTRIDDVGLSSLQFADVVFTLEEEYETEFDPARAADAKTLGDLIALGNDAIASKVS